MLEPLTSGRQNSMSACYLRFPSSFGRLVGDPKVCVSVKNTASVEIDDGVRSHGLGGVYAV
jgi:hypothetical protein